MKNNRSQYGFSLIELAVLLTVVAVVTIGYLTWIQPPALNQAQRTILTLERLRAITHAIQNFRVEKERLPCPADPAVRVDNTVSVTATQPANTPPGLIAAGGSYPYWGFGKEMLDENNLPTDTYENDCINRVGTIPTIALNLEPEMMEDGWGRKFTYHVSSTLCGTGVSKCQSNTYNSTSTSGDITVTDFTPTNLTTEAAFVVTSHGPNGYGAFTHSGTKLTDSADSDEIENTDSYSAADTTYVKDVFVQNGFDDIVIYQTKAQLDSLVSVRIDQQICTDNSAAIGSVTVADATTMYNNVTYTQTDNGNGTCVVSAPPTADCVNTGDEAILSIMLALQEICLLQYSGLSGSCPGSGSTYITDSNNTHNSCQCDSGDWSAC